MPCHPDSLAVPYALKSGERVTPLTAMIPAEVLINGAANTIIYEQDGGIRKHLAQHPDILIGAGANRVKGFVQAVLDQSLTRVTSQYSS